MNILALWIALSLGLGNGEPKDDLVKRISASLAQRKSFRIKFREEWPTNQSIPANEKSALSGEKSISEIETYWLPPKWRTYRTRWVTRLNGEEANLRDEIVVTEDAFLSIMHEPGKTISRGRTPILPTIFAKPLIMTGFRIDLDLEIPLSEMLNHPKTKITNEETKGEIGKRFFQLMLGPGIDKSVRPKWWNDTYRVRITFDEQRDLLPTIVEFRWENYMSRSIGNKYVEKGQDLIHKLETLSFQQVVDETTGMQVWFPKRIRQTLPNGLAMNYDILDATVNPKLTDSRFVASIPPGYSMFDRATGQMTGISGEEKSKQGSFEKKAKDAKRMMEEIEKQRSTQNKPGGT